ncbi:hypothetical protein ACFGVR_19470 [Mucilaginibacter sp. AW1-3]
MRKTILFCFIAILFVFTSCKTTIRPEAVVGKWKYIKVGNPYSRNPDDTVSSRELAEKAPYITLSPNGELTIVSEGKVLSHGKYQLVGSNIEVAEQLPDGKTRNFPFYISKLTDTEIIFETKEDDAVRVTARRAK